jgi:HK97 gp10 family phage protein
MPAGSRGTGLRFKVVGTRALLARFAAGNAIGVAAANVSRDAIADEIALSARMRAPIGETGDLHDSIAHVGGGRVVAAVRYAPFVEYGTAYQTAQPFLRPAADEVLGSNAGFDAGAAILRRI